MTDYLTTVSIDAIGENVEPSTLWPGLNTYITHKIFQNGAFFLKRPGII